MSSAVPASFADLLTKLTLTDWPGVSTCAANKLVPSCPTAENVALPADPDSLPRIKDLAAGRRSINCWEVVVAGKWFTRLMVLAI